MLVGRRENTINYYYYYNNRMEKKTRPTRKFLILFTYYITHNSGTESWFQNFFFFNYPTINKLRGLLFCNKVARSRCYEIILKSISTKICHRNTSVGTLMVKAN